MRRGRRGWREREREERKREGRVEGEKGREREGGEREKEERRERGMIFNAQRLTTMDLPDNSKVVAMNGQVLTRRLVSGLC